MKKILTAMSVAMLAASPLAMAQSNNDVEPAQGPLNAQIEQGGAAGVSGSAVNTGTLVGIGAGVLAAGALIALAADGDDDGDVNLDDGDINMTPTTTTTTTTN